jgi:hypothetical protein
MRPGPSVQIKPHLIAQVRSIENKSTTCQSNEAAWRPLVGTQVNILPLQLYSMISETGSDFPAAAALSLLLMAFCTCVVAVGEIVAARHEA